MALFALQAAADAGEPRVRLNPWRDWPPRRGSARRLRLHVAEHRLQAEQAGIAQGAQFVEADAGEDFHAAQRIGAAQGLLQLAGTAGRGAGANGGSAALDGMQGRGAARTSPSPSWRSSWAKRSACPERSAATPGRSAPRSCRRNARRYRPAPRPVRPRPLPLPARPGAAPAEMTEQAKHQALLVDRLRHMVVHARRQAASRSASEALAVMADRQPGEAPVGADSPGRLETIDIRHLHVHQHPRRTARSPPAPAERPPARRRRATGRPRCSTARRRPAVQRVVLHYQQTHAPQPLGALHRARRRVGQGPCSPCNACSTESASCLGVTGLVRKSTKGGALWSRASASTSRP